MEKEVKVNPILLFLIILLSLESFHLGYEFLRDNIVAGILLGSIGFILVIIVILLGERNLNRENRELRKWLKNRKN